MSEQLRAELDEAIDRIRDLVTMDGYVDDVDHFNLIVGWAERGWTNRR